MNLEEEPIDAESLRRRNLIRVQRELQEIWDKIDLKNWSEKWTKYSEKEIDDLWERYEDLEMVERGLLRTGSLMVCCSGCGNQVWDSKYFAFTVPFCRKCTPNR